MDFTLYFKTFQIIAAATANEDTVAPTVSDDNWLLAPLLGVSSTGVASGEPSAVVVVFAPSLADEGESLTEVSVSSGEELAGVSAPSLADEGESLTGVSVGEASAGVFSSSLLTDDGAPLIGVSVGEASAGVFSPSSLTDDGDGDAGVGCCSSVSSCKI